MKKIIASCFLFVFTLLCLSGCSDRPILSAETPVTLTMWHVYGSQTKSPLNSAINEFNRTVGKDNGVIIQVVSVTSSSAIDKALSASANHEPGAEKLPDLFTAYPRVAEIVGTDNLLSWNDYFSPDELSLFTDAFLSEGYFDERLLMLPIAKSTEVFYINQTLFDRFCKENSVTTADLSTFGDLFRVAEMYYDWSGGQNFMQLNDYYNYAYVGMKAYGEDFVKDGQLQLDNDAFKQVWYPLAEAAIRGGICLEDGYAAARWKTIEVIANTGSTADVLYQPDKVIYADNSTESITALALPYPTYNKETACVVYRGGGLFAIKNEDERKNQAAYLFAKWITEKENNLDFVTSAGYLPVTDVAFDLLLSNLNSSGIDHYHSLYASVDTMLRNYEFYALPLYRNASETQLNFETNVKTVLKSLHIQYLNRIAAGENKESVLSELVSTSLAELITLSGK